MSRHRFDEGIFEDGDLSNEDCGKKLDQIYFVRNLDQGGELFGVCPEFFLTIIVFFFS